jgi:hypothetical protein
VQSQFDEEAASERRGGRTGVLRVHPVVLPGISFTASSVAFTPRRSLEHDVVGVVDG